MTEPASPRDVIEGLIHGISQGRWLELHETGDPEVVIAEYDYDGLATTTGRSFQVANIQVSRVRDGQIVTSRDYHNHPVTAEAIAERPA